MEKCAENMEHLKIYENVEKAGKSGKMENVEKSCLRRFVAPSGLEVARSRGVAAGMPGDRRQPVVEQVERQDLGGCSSNGYSCFLFF